MKQYLFLIFCVLPVFGVIGGVSAKVPPCSTPPAISGADTVCEGLSITLSDNTIGGIWSSSNTGVAAIDSVTGMVTGISGGTAVITYTIPPSCFVTMSIFVDPLARITGNPEICVGSSVLFSDLSTTGTWSSSNTTVATIDAGTGNAYGDASGTTIITYTIPNGCYAKILVTVNPLPLAYYVFGGGNYCAGTPGATIGLDGSDSGINYVLYNGSVYVDSLYGAGSTLFYGPYTATGTYKIIAVNITTRCTNTMPGIATIGVIPDNIPSVSITTGMGDTVCDLTTTTFSPLPVDAGASPSYQWFVNGTSMGTGNTYSYIPANGDIVSVIITSDAVCAIPSTATSSMRVTTIPKETPSVSLSVIPGDTVCEYVYATIIPAPVYGGSAPTYRWIKNGITAGTGPVYNYLPMNGDNILCTILSNYKCLITDSTYSSNNINMTVIPVLVPTVIVTAHPGDTITVGESDTLVAAVEDGGLIPTYQWEINGVTIPGATMDTYISSAIDSNDTVTCVVNSSYVCDGGPVSAYLIFTDTVMPSLGIGLQASPGGAVNIAPNPNKGIFTISGTIASDDNAVAIEISDVLGQLIYKRTVPLENGKLYTSIDLGEQLANGVYLIHIMANNANVFSRFTLNR